jgi:hypothetical protein
MTMMNTEIFSERRCQPGRLRRLLPQFLDLGILGLHLVGRGGTAGGRNGLTASSGAAHSAILVEEVINMSLLVRMGCWSRQTPLQPISIVE